MNELKLQVTINPNQNVDLEEMIDLTRSLRRAILEADVVSVDFPKASAPQETKTFDSAIWGNVLVTIAASGGVLTTLINLLSGWMKRNEQKSITLEIDGDKLEIKGVSNEEQQRLINLWLSRHRGYILEDK